MESGLWSVHSLDGAGGEVERISKKVFPLNKSTRKQQSLLSMKL